LPATFEKCEQGSMKFGNAISDSEVMAGFALFLIPSRRVPFIQTETSSNEKPTNAGYLWVRFSLEISPYTSIVVRTTVKRGGKM